MGRMGKGDWKKVQELKSEDSAVVHWTQNKTSRLFYRALQVVVKNSLALVAFGLCPHFPSFGCVDDEERLGGPL